MNVLRPRELQTLTPDFDLMLENQLRMSLRPVRPNPEFVDHLHNRLSSPQVVVERHRNQALSMILIAISLLSGMIFLWASRRWRRPMPSAAA